MTGMRFQVLTFPEPFFYLFSPFLCQLFRGWRLFRWRREERKELKRKGSVRKKAGGILYLQRSRAPTAEEAKKIFRLAFFLATSFLLSSSFPASLPCFLAHIFVFFFLLALEEKRQPEEKSANRRKKTSMWKRKRGKRIGLVHFVSFHLLFYSFLSPATFSFISAAKGITRMKRRKLCGRRKK